jgi:MFS superfamily sulfate permease-like transporter
VIIAVLGLVQPAELVRFWRLSKPEFWVAVATALAGLFADMLAAVLVGVLLTLVLVIWELDHIGVTELRPTPDGSDLRPAGDGSVAAPGLLVLRVDGPLYTANVRSVNRRIIEAVDRARPETLVLDMSAVAEMTVTVALQSADLERELTSRGVTIWVAGLAPRALALAQEMPRWESFESTGRVYPTALAATRAYLAR